MEKSNFDLYSEFGHNFWYIKARQDLLSKLIKKTSIKNNKNAVILDAGCGAGFNYPALNKFGDVYNLDLSNDALKICKKRKLKHIYKSDICHTSFKDKKFDLICSIELLEHIPKEEAFTNEIYRILKKDGYLILTVPAYNFLWGVDDELAHHQRRYTIKRLKKVFEKNKKFKIKFISYRYFFLFFPTVPLFIIQKIKNMLYKKKSNSLSFTPSFMNKILIKIMKLENTLLSSGIKFPFGVGIVCIIKKTV